MEETPIHPRTKPFDDQLRAELAAYRDRHTLTGIELARQLGTSSTQVSKYLNGRPEGDVEKFEGLVRDILKNESRREQSRNKIFDTFISKQMNGVFRTIQATNDFGLISGPAGIGKTCGIELFAANNPSVIAVTVSIWSKSATAIEGLLFSTLATRAWKHNTKRAEFMVDKLRGSNRLIVVDNAHKLDRQALSWLFDFHDATDCPVCLVGNPEILDAIRKNDQHFSRIGKKCELKIKTKEASDVATRIVEQIAPGASSSICDLACLVAEKHGHFRAVRKNIMLAKNLHDHDDADTRANNADWAKAFRAGHTQLVRDYALT